VNIILARPAGVYLRGRLSSNVRPHRHAVLLRAPSRFASAAARSAPRKDKTYLVSKCLSANTERLAARGALGHASATRKALRRLARWSLAAGLLGGPAALHQPQGVSQVPQPVRQPAPQ